MGQDVYVIVADSAKSLLVEEFEQCDRLQSVFADLLGKPVVTALFPGMPETLATFADLSQLAKAVSSNNYKLPFAADYAQSSILRLLESVRELAIRIPDQEGVNLACAEMVRKDMQSVVADTDSSTSVWIILVSEDNNFQVGFASRRNESWVLTPRHFFSRARHGSLWQEDPSLGVQSWDACSLRAHRDWNQSWLSYYKPLLPDSAPQREFGHFQYGKALGPLQVKCLVAHYQAMVDYYDDLIARYT